MKRRASALFDSPYSGKIKREEPPAYNKLPPKIPYRNHNRQSSSSQSQTPQQFHAQSPSPSNYSSTSQPQTPAPPPPMMPPEFANYAPSFFSPSPSYYNPQMGMMPFMGSPQYNMYTPPSPMQPQWPYAGPSYGPQQNFDPSKPPPPLPTEVDRSGQRPPLPPGNPPGSPPPQMNGMRHWGRNVFRGGGIKRGSPMHMMPSPGGNEMMENAILANTMMANGVGVGAGYMYNGYNTLPDMYEDKHNNTQINRKSKRKPMSTRYTRAREWDRDDAIKALKLEKEFNRQQKTPMLILRFPDPELNKYKVRQYSPQIESVHFQQPSTPRYCFVQLKQGADIDKVCEELSAIPFGAGKIVAERKHQHFDDPTPVSPDEIDPYTLYIGNLPTQISVKVVKEHFPGAQRIDIGYAQRMKYTRYAFIRYSTIEESMEAYKNTFNKLIDSRSLIVRFRRQKGNMGLPGETKIPNPRKETPMKPPEGEIVERSESVEDNSQIIIREAETPETASDEFWDPNNQEEEDDNTVDTKSNVLDEAREFMEKSRSKPGANGDSNGVYGQGDVKPDPDRVVYVTSDTGLLGTQIKDEPLDDDELLAQAQCYDDDDFYDDDDAEEPEEEDDVAQEQYSPSSSSHFSNFLRPPVENWEDFRRNELSRKEDKPPKDILVGAPTNPGKTANNGKGPNNKSPEKGPASSKSGGRDELDDLFNQVNGDDDDDGLNDDPF